jgi:Flp pilus assembly protein TadG
MTIRRTLHRLRTDERGTTLVELAFCIALFLLIFFALIDFGRMAYNWVTAEKAVQVAARIAAVRPPVCAGVPTNNQAGTASTIPNYGTTCSSGSNICRGESLAPFSCSAASGGATAGEIWGSVRDLLPANATPDNLQFTYSYDPRMNFLGGPYVPVVTVELRNLDFFYTSPLLGLARMAGATVSGSGDTRSPVRMPTLSVSLPGEDLALGTNG